MQAQLETETHIISPQIVLGMRRHKAGDLAGAAKCYQRSIETSPQNPDALLLLGIAARQARYFSLAIMLIKAAIELRPAPHYFLNLAQTQRVAGDLMEAAQTCIEALKLNPRNPELHCQFADILAEANEFAAAQKACEHALELQPVSANTHYCQGNLQCRQSDFAEAVISYGKAIALNPKGPEFYLALGYALNKLGDTRKAHAAFASALRLRPIFAEAHLNLGNLYYDRGLIPAAMVHYRFALRIQPGYAKAHINLGNSFSKLGRFPKAIACYRQALRIQPESATAQHGLGNALAEEKSWAPARESLEKALAISPHSAEIHNSLGNLHYNLKNMSSAAQHYRQAIDLNSTYARAYINLGNALQALGKHWQARALYEHGLTLDGSSPGALYNLALSQLRNGEFGAGWQNYESRWDFGELRLGHRNLRAPLWRGEPLAGKTILLHAEQGLGDTIQFARYAPLVAACGGRVILETQPALVRLMQRIHGIDAVLARGAALPAFDYHCPLMSLPLAFETTLDTIPSPGRYLRAETSNSSPVNKAVQTGINLRIGIAWSGNPRHRSDANRSIPLVALLRITEASNATLISLQKGAGTEQLTPYEGRSCVIDASSAHADMEETASLIETLDLVVCVDTSIAHLAGAMGKPAWIMLSRVADWRWMEDRNDSPWYRSARLFRQKTAGDWNSVVDEIAAALGSQKR